MGAKYGSTVAVTASDSNHSTIQVRKAAIVIVSKTTQTTGAGGTGNIALLGLVILVRPAAPPAGYGLAQTFQGDTEIPILEITKTGSGVTMQGVITAEWRKCP